MTMTTKYLIDFNKYDANNFFYIYNFNFSFLNIVFIVLRDNVYYNWSMKMLL